MAIYTVLRDPNGNPIKVEAATRDGNGKNIANNYAEKTYVDNAISSAISRVYKPQGTVTVNTLNSLSITKEMNGYVYDISGTGTLTKGSVQVTQGDNVAIIWNEDETDWKWDKLSSIVDLSNYAEKTYVNHALNGKVNRVVSHQGDYLYGVYNGADKIYPLQKQVGYNGIVQRTGDGNVVVPLAPATDDCATSKKYVDDGLKTKMNVFLEVSSFLNLPTVGSASTFYVTVDDNKLYRWTGSTYIEVGNSKVLTTNTPTKFRNYTQEVPGYPYMQSLASDGKYIFGIISKWAEQERDIVACSYDLNGNLIATKELNESATLEQCCGLTVKDGKLIIFQNGGVEKSVTINADGTFGANWEVYTGFKFAEINSTTPLQDVVYSKNLNRLYVKPYDGTDTVYIYANDASATTNNTLLGTFKLKIIDGVSFTRMTISDNCVFANYTSNGIMYPLIAVYTIDGEYLYTSNISYTPEEASVGIDFPEGETFDVEHSNTQGILYLNDSIYFTSISFSTGYLRHKSAIVKCTLINDSKQLILGETGSTAYPGNKGKANADNIKHLQETKADITYVDNAIQQAIANVLTKEF